MDPNACNTFLFVGDVSILRELEPFLNSWEGAVTACTTCGEIAGGEYHEGSLLALSVVSEHLECKNLFISLEDFDKEDFISKIKNEISDFRVLKMQRNPEVDFFSTLIIDGVSFKEERFVNMINRALLDVPMVGGSAGDNFKFKSAYIFDGKKFVQNGACLTLWASERPFKIFKIQDFVPTDKKAVITESLQEKRLVTEINGLPAAKAYAEMAGVDVSKLGLDIFSKHPLMLRLGGEEYIRSVAYVTPEGALSFACAIETGVVLRLGKKVETMAENAQAVLKEVLAPEFKLQGTLIFECGLRKMDVLGTESGERENLMKEYEKLKAVGFHTYGEQLGSVHINQTLTGVSFGG